jgi:hypothetical protein
MDGPPFGLPNALYRLGNPYGAANSMNVGQFGARPDGTQKGTGWLGMLPRPDGGVSTELSAGVEIGGKETLIPLLVPTLAPDEVNWLLKAAEDDPQFFNKMPPSILDKAVQHATQRIHLGLNPFAK